MDSSSQSLDWSHRVNAPLGAALAAIFTLAPSMLVAQTLPGTSPEVVSASVSLADLDLTTAEGRRAAQNRLKATAQRLCLKFWDHRVISGRETYFQCTRDTLASALAQLKAAEPAIQLAKEVSGPSPYSQ